ncbi:MAG: serine/threonine protein kinase [Calditrichia bacterium]
MKIEGFELLDELSRGPITTVYRGKQSALDRPVLIKVLNTQWQKDDELVERFRREALICARLKHPNIISIFDVGTEKDALYMIIEFVEGNPLDEFIQLHSPLPFDIICSISRGILSGLHYAHDHKVIHRDIKPANILISSEGRAQIVDFGLATVADLPKVTAQYGTVGTPAYMSPEQISGSAISSSSDLFSCGITFYEMAVGESPFAAKSAGECMQQILNNVPPAPNQLRPELPDWFSNLVMDMLQKDVTLRPGTASELLVRFDTSETNPDSPRIAKLVAAPHVNNSMPRQGRDISSFENTFSGGKLLLMVGILLSSLFIAIAAHQWRTPVHSRADKQTEMIMPDTLSNQNPLEEPDVETLIETSQTEINPKEPSLKRGEPMTTVRDTLAVAKKEPILAQAENGFLHVLCNPWGVIYLNGIEYDTTPMMEPIELPAGRHSIEIRNPNFSTYSDSLSIQSARTDSLAIDLSPLLGYLDLTVIPWANVHCNGRFIETTPLSQPLELPQGRHLLMLSNPNFQTWSDSISIIADQVTRKKITLTP